MLDILQVSSILKVCTALLTLLVLFALLRWQDRRHGFSFRDWMRDGDAQDVNPEVHKSVGIYLSLRFLGLCILLGLLMGCNTPAYAAPVNKYDRQIASAAKTWLPGVDWKLLRAQYWQESRLNPDAKSYVGAAGVAQFMPKTWKNITAELGWKDANPHDPDAAIEAGAYYMATLRRSWADLPDYERHSHAMASYNAGPGNIRKAWRLSGRTGKWEDTASSLPKVTGKYAKETQGYVRNIWRWYASL